MQAKEQQQQQQQNGGGLGTRLNKFLLVLISGENIVSFPDPQYSTRLHVCAVLSI